jgi:predicted kinase
MSGTLIEFGGLPGSGKSTLAGRLAGRTGALWLRIDEIEDAMRRHGLTPAQTGIAAYSVAHDVAASHLRRGMTVIADAVNPVRAARDGWRGLAAEAGARHVVVETSCPDPAEHRRRLDAREGFVDLIEVYEPRTDERLQVDTTRAPAECDAQIDRALAAAAGKVSVPAPPAG